MDLANPDKFLDIYMRCDLAECGWDLAQCRWWDLAVCKWDLAEWFERLTANAQVATVLWVRSQHSPSQWNQRGGRWSTVEWNIWKTKGRGGTSCRRRVNRCIVFQSKWRGCIWHLDEGWIDAFNAEVHGRIRRVESAVCRVGKGVHLALGWGMNGCFQMQRC